MESEILLKEEIVAFLRGAVLRDNPPRLSFFRRVMGFVSGRIY